MSKRKNLAGLKPWRTRQFLRPANDDVGPGSIISASFRARLCDKREYNSESEEREKTGQQYVSIAAGIGFRDCSGEAAFEFYCGNSGRKQAMKHLKAIEKLEAVIMRLANDYRRAIDAADAGGWWADEQDTDSDYDY